jgi:hypothetical protein
VCRSNKGWLIRTSGVFPTAPVKEWARAAVEEALLMMVRANIGKSEASHAGFQAKQLIIH